MSSTSGDNCRTARAPLNGSRRPRFSIARRCGWRRRRASSRPISSMRWRRSVCASPVKISAAPSVFWGWCASACRPEPARRSTSPSRRRSSPTSARRSRCCARPPPTRARPSRFCSAVRRKASTCGRPACPRLRRRASRRASPRCCSSAGPTSAAPRRRLPRRRRMSKSPARRCCRRFSSPPQAVSRARLCRRCCGRNRPFSRLRPV